MRTRRWPRQITMPAMNDDLDLSLPSFTEEAYDMPNRIQCGQRVLC
jgi:hypothetical protein